jgi:hypothetical protein
MDPFRAGRRLFAQRCQARLKENREQSRSSARKFADIRKDRFSRFHYPRSGRVIFADLTRGCELFVGAAAELRGRLILGDFLIARTLAKRVVRLDQQPRLSLLS